MSNSHPVWLNFISLIWFPNSSSYEEDFENSEGDEDDEEEDEEDAAAAADAEPAPVPAAEEPIAGIYISLPALIPPNNAGVKRKRKEKIQGSHTWVNAAETASHPSKKRKLAPPKIAQADFEEISDENEAGGAGGAGGSAGGSVDGAEEEDVEDEEEQFYESENGEEEAVDLLPAGKRSVANKSNAKASIKSAELVGNDDDDDDDEWIKSPDVVPILSWMGNDTRYIFFFLQPVKQYPSHSKAEPLPPPHSTFSSHGPFPPLISFRIASGINPGGDQVIFILFLFVGKKKVEGAGGGGWSIICIF